jgi:hypothetical protein
MGNSSPVVTDHLGAAMHRTQEVAGSSPASSINESPPTVELRTCGE